MAHQKTRKRAAPEEIRRLKRDLALDRQFLAPIKNFVRLEKTVGASQTIGADNQPVITWQEAQRDIGGGADIPSNRFVVPQDRSGLWRMRVSLVCSSATVDPNSNYRVVLTRNGAEFSFAHNHTSATRAASPRLQDERYLDEGDAVQVQMQNSTDATKPTPSVDVIEGSHVVFEFIGTVEE